MKVNDLSKNGTTSDSRIDVSPTAPTGGLSNVSQQDNGKVLMNKPELDTRGSRADALIDIMGMDSERLNVEAPRHTKIVG